MLLLIVTKNSGNCLPSLNATVLIELLCIYVVATYSILVYVH